MAGVGRNSPRKYTEEEKALQAAEIFELRLQKMSYKAIQEKLGLSYVTVQTRMKQYRREIVYPHVEDMRKDLTEEYDRLSQKLEQDLDSPKPNVRAKAIEVRLKIMTAMREMHGIDVPVKSEVAVTTTLALDGNIASLLERIQQKEIGNTIEGEIIDGLDADIDGGTTSVVDSGSGYDREAE